MRNLHKNLRTNGMNLQCKVNYNNHLDHYPPPHSANWQKKIVILDLLCPKWKRKKLSLNILKAIWSSHGFSSQIQTTLSDQKTLETIILNFKNEQNTLYGETNLNNNGEEFIKSSKEYEFTLKYTNFHRIHKEMTYSKWKLQ